MSLNAKNDLQEIFQKKGLPLPKYRCNRCGGADHRPLWVSTVTIPEGKEFKGIVHSSKSSAEISAASAALEYIKQSTISSNSVPTRSDMLLNNDGISSSLQSLIPVEQLGNMYTTNIGSTGNIQTTNVGNIAMLVDVENRPKFIDNIADLIANYTIYAFIGEHHCLAEKVFPQPVIKIISPSTRPDGTDTCMQVYTGMLLTLEKYDGYIIVTQDHYGSTLVEMITSSIFGWKAKPARVVSRPSQLQ